MKIIKIIGLLLAAGATGAISCVASKEACNEIKNKDIDELSEMDDDSTIPNDTVEI